MVVGRGVGGSGGGGGDKNLVGGVFFGKFFLGGEGMNKFLAGGGGLSPISPVRKTLYIYMPFGRTLYIELYGPFFWMRCTCLKAIQSHYEEIVYFYPEIPCTH